MKLKRIAVAILLAAALAPPAGGATYYVDQATGDDAAAGSKEAPLKTVAAGVKKLAAGDTLILGEGVYRESVSVRVRGTADSPVVIQAAPGARVVLSGGERIAGWKKCARSDAPGNANFQSIHYADIDWQPSLLFEDGKSQEIARTPNEGYWICKGVTPESITDPVHLTQTSADAWAGATVFYFRYFGVAQKRSPIARFDPETHTLHVESLVTGGHKTYTPGLDRYYLINKSTMIDRPGEWACEKTGEKSWRIYYWPHGKDIAKALVEVPRRLSILQVALSAYLTVDGLELRHALPSRGSGSAIGGQADRKDPLAGHHLTIRNCTIHHNGRFGISLRYLRDVKIANCLIYRNQYGVNLTTLKSVLVEGNEIAENLVDGLLVTWGCRNIVVSKNYIHHHNLFGHPDNIQTYQDVKNVVFDSNLVLSAGQSVMMQESDGFVWRNNVIAGSNANMMICGHGSSHNYVFERNTLVMWANSLFILSGRNYELRNNIMVNTGGTVFYNVPKEGKFASDHNLMYIAPGHSFKIGTYVGEGGKKLWFSTLDDVRRKVGHEKNSEWKDPQLANVPAYLTQLDGKKISACTREKLFIRRVGLFKVGDVVEVHFDGVVRKVTAVEGNTITVVPPLPTAPDRAMLVANWKDKTNLVLDFASPFNDKYGSTIDVKAYRKGDFDGDGKRDVPKYRD